MSSKSSRLSKPMMLVSVLFGLDANSIAGADSDVDASDMLSGVEVGTNKLPIFFNPHHRL